MTNPKSNSDPASGLSLPRIAGNQLVLAEPASPPSLQDEIDILRSTLRWLQDTFKGSGSTQERLKLSNSMCLVSASLSRLLRTQAFLLSKLPSAFDTALNDALSDILKEWGRT